MKKNANGNQKSSTKNTKSQEDKIMKNKKAQEVKVEEVKTEEVKTEEKKVEENTTKANKFISIEEVVKLYAEAGIRCTNPNAKGNYRIMGSKSSLNLLPTKGYYIYSSKADYEAVQNANITGNDLVLEGECNKQDSNRPFLVICKTVETLKALLAVYAVNPLNAVKVAENK